MVPVRLGTKSFDLEYRAAVGGRPVCTGSITYVSVRPGSGESVPIPDDVRAAFEGAMYDGFRGSTGGGE